MAAPKASPGKQGKTVLVVDDNPLIRRNVCEELTSSGFDSCVEAENGVDALTKAAKVTPDLIILDLAMPMMNGLEAAPLLRNMLPATPIILYTLYGSTLRGQDFSEIGITETIPKDEPLERLVSRAQSLTTGSDSSSGRKW